VTITESGISLVASVCSLTF